MALKILIGGSPCTHWSIAQRNNREVKAEGVGWELFRNYLIAKEKFKPDLFLYENNKSAAQPIKDQISRELGVDLMYINSALVSAQNRQRFYAFNWTVDQPEDRGILLKDILESGEDLTSRDKAFPLTATYAGAIPSNTIQHQQRTMVAVPVDKRLSRLGGLYDQATRWGIWDTDGVSPTLTASMGMGGGHIPMIAEKTQQEGECATNPTDKPKIYRVKNGLLEIGDQRHNVKLSDGFYIIRKLTVTECCRLQTMPDNYCNAVSNSQAYILLMDFSKFYDNIRHEELLKLFRKYVHDDLALWLLEKTIERARVDVSYMTEEEYAHCEDSLFNSLEYQKIDKSLLTGEKFMDKHMNIGDQVAQVAGVAYPIPIDNYVKIVRAVKFYARYMDDSYAIHESKEFLEELLKEIIVIAKSLGITVNERKTRICKLSDYWRFLQIQYSLTETGRVVQKINPKRLTAMRRKMKKLAYILPEKDFHDWFYSWFKGHVKYMSKLQRENILALFNQLKEVCRNVHSQTQGRDEAGKADSQRQ